MTALLLFALASFQIPPTPGTAVNDYAGVLPASEKAAIEASLAKTQVVVAIFRSLEGEDRDELVNRIFRTWGVGQKGKNDGVLLAIFVEDRKWRIEVGYGAEPVLTDAQAAMIGEQELVPRLRAGDYAGAVRATTSRILAVLERRAAAPRPRAVRGPGINFNLIFILIVIVLGLVQSLARRRRGVLGARGFSALPWWWWFGGGGGGGGWGGGGGGGWGGGGDSGNFGGGDSGGGGAGGSW
ncbi:MAG TPA: TPM domain-containing protein [Polyangia bacterium]|nr:TPM domain-containing protein [Polyangia bacterium]